MRTTNFLVFLLTTLLAGCTSVLWSPTYQQTTITGLYINTETNELLASDDRYAYVFGIDEPFVEVLVSYREFELRPSFWNFKLDKNNGISGEVTLYVQRDSLTEEDSRKLKSQGFTTPFDNGKYAIERDIVGKRYEIEGELPFEAEEVSYTVNVAQPLSNSSAIGKLVASPVTIAYDTVVVVPAVFVGAAVMAAGGEN